MKTHSYDAWLYAQDLKADRWRESFKKFVIREIKNGDPSDILDIDGVWEILEQDQVLIDEFHYYSDGGRYNGDH